MQFYKSLRGDYLKNNNKKNITLLYNDDFYTRFGITVAINEFCIYNAHTHDFFEFEYVLEGEGECIIDGKTYPVKADDLIFVSPSNVHSYNCKEKKLKVISLHFTDRILNHRFDFTNAEACVLNAVSETKNMFLDTYYEWNRFDQYSFISIINAVERIIIYFMRRINSGTECSVNVNINSARSYIIQNFRQNITLEKISKKFGYSPEYFSRLFKKETGLGFYSYLTDIRLNYAKTMLASAPMSVNDICFESGFNSIRSFNRSYKRKFGVAPSQDKMSKTVR